MRVVRGSSIHGVVAVISALVACDQILGLHETTVDPPGSMGGTAQGSKSGAGTDGGEAGDAGSQGGRAASHTGGTSMNTESGGANAAGHTSRTGGAGGSEGTGVTGGSGGTGGDGAGTGGAAGDSGGGEAGDGGGGAGGGGGGGVGDWTPLDLENLALWLEPPIEKSDGYSVEAWKDRSPYAHLAVQSVAESRPTFSATALAGLPGLEFDGTNDMLYVADHPAFWFGSDASFVIEIVFSHRSSIESAWAGGNLILAKTASEQLFPGVVLAANRPIVGLATTRLGVQLNISTFAVTPEGPYNDGQPRLIGIHRLAPAEFELRINGVLIDRTASYPVDVSAMGSPMRIGGGREDAIQTLEGVISEIVSAKHVTTDDVHRLETYLMQKYASALSSR